MPTTAGVSKYFARGNRIVFAGWGFGSVFRDLHRELQSTHCPATGKTQNQAVNNRAGSSPASGRQKRDLYERKFIWIFFVIFPVLRDAENPFQRTILIVWFFRKGFSICLNYNFLFISKHLLILRCSIQCSEVVLRGFCAADDFKAAVLF